MSPPPAMILVAGFGDNQTVYEPLLETRLARVYELAPIELPGFGAPPLPGGTTLERLAEVVDAKAKELGARLMLVHSLASVIASLAALRPNSPIDTILSLEGNLTADDAYFSGMAAAFDTPDAFRSAFLARLGDLARTEPSIERYRTAVESADAQALWDLGIDAHAFSAAQAPGDILARTRRVAYFYNPDNLSPASLAWLDQSRLKRIPLATASHWKCFEEPHLMAQCMIEALDEG